MNITEIEAIVNDAVASEPTLASINTTSQTGWFAALRRFVARTWQLMFVYLDAYKIEVSASAANQIAGTNNWLAEQARKFQYGDSLVVVNGVVTYPVIDTTKQIVKYSSSVDVEVSGVLYTYVKVAKQVDGLPVKLDTDEVLAFTSYLNKIKFAGVRTDVISIDADLVKATITVYYNGQLLQHEVQTAVETAINNYLNGITYDGVLNINLLRDAVEAVDGVIAGGCDITQLQAKPYDEPYATVTRIYSPKSGYYKVDPANPLSSTITYTAI